MGSEMNRVEARRTVWLILLSPGLLLMVALGWFGREETPRVIRFTDWMAKKVYGPPMWQ